MSAPHGELPGDAVGRALARARGVLPDQGPIGVFIHHNTLHAYQHLPFHDAVQQGADALGARPYLTQHQFRRFLNSGRISDTDLGLEIAVHLGTRAGEPILPGFTRAALWHLLMVAEPDTDDAAGLDFAIHIGQSEVCRDPELWEACLARVASGPRRTPPRDARRVRRHRDVLVARGANDTDVTVHGELVRLSSGHLDQGQAPASLPDRHKGFLRAAAGLYATGSVPRQCRGLSADMRQVLERNRSASTIIDEVLEDLGVGERDIEDFLFATALALPGWAGMFARIERHPEEHPGGPPASLDEFVAVRLMLERRAYASACRDAGLPLFWERLRVALPSLPLGPSVLDAALLWNVAHAAGLDATAVSQMRDDLLESVWIACSDCSDLERRRVFQNAFERTYRCGVLDAMAARRRLEGGQIAEVPRAQFVFCIDEREESIRRALEEQHPGYITFGAAGFFGVAIDYKGLYDLEPAAHCPVVVTPAHEVHEQPIYTDLSWHAFRLGLRDRWHRWERQAARASRTLTGGAGASLLLGPLSGLTTATHLLTPRSWSTLARSVTERFAPRPGTRLSTIRAGDEPPTEHVKPMGFSLQESVDRVTALLTNLGLVRDFAPIVVVLGHGSTSLNNPHESAHDCGACGGRRGGANARLFADMANRPDVRAGVRARGIDIPATTWFVGALHDTASDAVLYYDLNVLPRTHGAHFDEAHAALERARRDNALERSRRFDDAPLTLTPDEALEHVEERATSLAQPRPEYGHCTNSICIVGRRSLTRGLHLDRRAFLVSYDPTVETETFAVLERILAAVGPVGAGISLEYYFSSVDNETFGCGTKLPHNVTGLIGVMNGHQGDLRTGLPWQMVEIHEPMRLLLIVDASPEALLAVAGRQPEVAELVGKEWVQLVSSHPVTGETAVFENGRFVPYVALPTLLPVVERSAEWHQRTRAHVTPALVRRALPATIVGPRHADRPVADELHA